MIAPGPRARLISGSPVVFPPSNELTTRPRTSEDSAPARVTVDPAPGMSNPTAPLITATHAPRRTTESSGFQTRPTRPASSVMPDSAAKS